jgi:glycosyltransferase involved in cell wall biosynthesis
MSAGLPVIASDWSGYRDIVRPGRTGWLVPTQWADCVSRLGARALLVGDGDPHWIAGQTVVVDLPAVVNAMERIAGDEALRRRLGASGRAVARTVFGGRAIVQRYDDLWEHSFNRRAAATGLGAVTPERPGPARRPCEPGDRRSRDSRDRS